MSIRVLLADDHQMMRDGLRAVLAVDPDILIVGEAGNGRTTLELVEKLTPDIVVMDIGMPDLNGLEATRQLRIREPAVRVIALSTYSDKRYVREMLDAGAAGYVVKAGASEQLRRAIHAVARNQTYLSPEIAPSLDATTGGPATAPLSPREREVLQLLAEGKPSRRIAQSLGVSLKTIEAHRRNIMRKLDLHNIADLTRYAIAEGLTYPDPPPPGHSPRPIA